MICGADDQIRTGDLILTKDALYRLSYISTSFDARFIILYPESKGKGFKKISFVNFSDTPVGILIADFCSGAAGRALVAFSDR